MIWMLAACSGPTNPPATTAPVGTPADVERDVTLTTRDGVDLVADVYPGEPGAHGVVLLHMTPVGGANRKDWPGDFISGLRERGWWVLRLDRRGAGDSGGVGQEAFDGPKGKYDVEAAVKLLDDRGAAAPALIGASNGTTSALDYTVWAAGEGLPEPVALGFMTGGTYTETQNELTGITVPAVFTYSTAERAWSVSKEPGAPASWSFLEYDGGAHGTRMFDARPEVSADLASFLDGVI